MAGSLMGKYKIAIDTGTLADGDSIASYLVDAAGLLLTSTTMGAKQRLDVNNPSEFVGDAASAFATDLGTSVLAQRHDANTTLASSDGNYAPLQLDANGALKVSGSLNATFTAEHNEDSASADGDSLMGIASVRQDTLASDTSADGDYAFVKSTAAGEIYVHDSDVFSQLVSANSTLTNIKSDTASIVTNTGNTATSAANIDTSTASIDTKSSSIVTNTGNTATSVASIDTKSTTIASNTGTTATNTGNTATSTASTAALLTALSKAEDAAHSSGDQGMQALAVRKDAQGSNAGSDGDYASLLTWSEGSLKVVDIANGSMLQQQISVTSTAGKLPASPLANRKSLMIQNTGSAKCYIGASSVTVSGATTGIELPANSFLELEVGPAVDVYAIKSGAGGSNVNILEMA